MEPPEKNGKTIMVIVVLSTFVVGMVIGALSSSLAASRFYVSVVDYQEDKIELETRRQIERAEILDRLSRLEQKLDELRKGGQ